MYLLKRIHLKYYSYSKCQDPFLLLQQSQAEPKRDEKAHKSVGAHSSLPVLPLVATPMACAAPVRKVSLPRRFPRMLALLLAEAHSVPWRLRLQGCLPATFHQHTKVLL